MFVEAKTMSSFDATLTQFPFSNSFVFLFPSINMFESRIINIDADDGDADDSANADASADNDAVDEDNHDDDDDDDDGD